MNQASRQARAEALRSMIAREVVQSEMPQGEIYMIQEVGGTNQ